MTTTSLKYLGTRDRVQGFVYSLTEEVFEQKVAAIHSDENYQIDISNAPVSKVVVLRKNTNQHILLWNCHHILTDGWSTAIVLQDVFQFYEGLIKDQKPTLETLPSYKTYFEALKKQKKDISNTFWANHFSNDILPSLFESQSSTH